MAHDHAHDHPHDGGPHEHPSHAGEGAARWKLDGVRVVPGEAVAINLDIEPAERPEQVLWVDPTHPKGGV